MALLRQLLATRARLCGRSPTLPALAPAVATWQLPVRLPRSGTCSMRGYASKRWLVPFDRSGSGVGSSVCSSLPWDFGNSLAFDEGSTAPDLLMRALEEPLLSQHRGDLPGSPPQVTSAASLLSSASGGEPEVRLTPDSFCVTVDVHQFEPGEVQVKVCDGALLIEARRGPRAGRHDSTVSRELLREFTIPGEVDQHTLACRLSPRDGSLSVEAKLKPQLQQGGAESYNRVLEIKTEPETPERKGGSISTTY